MQPLEVMAQEFQAYKNGGGTRVSKTLLAAGAVLVLVIFALSGQSPSSGSANTFQPGPPIAALAPPGECAFGEDWAPAPLVDRKKVSDDAVLLRRLVAGVARKHDLKASFMAKPFADQGGSGLHIHASAYREDGSNIFAHDEATTPPTLTEPLRRAIGGLQATIDEAMAIFAPNPNSYRRFTPGAFAPAGRSWGYDHREVALRVPASTEDNRRVEHRIAGADANPYLVLAVILAAALEGIEQVINRRGADFHSVFDGRAQRFILVNFAFLTIAE